MRDSSGGAPGAERGAAKVVAARETVRRVKREGAIWRLVMPLVKNSWEMGVVIDLYQP